jgi:hypothetical protein
MYYCLISKHKNEKRLAVTKAGTVTETTNLYKLEVRNAEGKRQLGNVVVLDGRMTIKCNLRKYSVTMWVRLLWLR